MALWLNFAPDHLDWHPDLVHYRDAKAKVWSRQDVDQVAVVAGDDPVGLRRLPPGSPPGPWCSGMSEGDWRVEGGHLVGPEGPLLAVAELPRGLPHDLTNALAAAATASEAGASLDAVRHVLIHFGGLPHRLTLVSDHGGGALVRRLQGDGSGGDGGGGGRVRHRRPHRR